MGEALITRGKGGHGVAMAAETVAVGHQPLQAHGASGGHGLGADAHLGAQSIAEAVGKAAGAVVKHPGTVHGVEETSSSSLVVRTDHVCVAGAMAANVFQGGLQILHHPDRQGQIQVFMSPVFRGGGFGHTQCPGLLVPPQRDASSGEGLNGRWQELAGHMAMHQERLNGVAGGGILGFGIQSHGNGHVDVHPLVHIEVANPIGVAQHGDAGVLLDGAHKGVGAAGHNQIHQLIQLEQGHDLLATGEQIQAVGVHGTPGQPLLQGCDNGLARIQRLPATLEDGAVAGANGQRRNLNHRIGARFKDNTQHPQGNGDPFQFQSCRQFPVQLTMSDGIGQGGHLP